MAKASFLTRIGFGTKKERAEVKEQLHYAPAAAQKIATDYATEKVKTTQVSEPIRSGLGKATGWLKKNVKRRKHKPVKHKYKIITRETDPRKHLNEDETAMRGFLTWRR